MNPYQRLVFGVAPSGSLAKIAFPMFAVSVGRHVRVRFEDTVPPTIPTSLLHPMPGLSKE